MKENNNLWVVVGVALVVSVIASFLTVQMTGNTVNVQTKNNSTATLYTKAEVDAMMLKVNSNINNKTSNQGVLNMFDKNCAIWSVSKPNATRQVTGDDICKERGAGICVFTVMYDNLNHAVNNNGALSGTNAGLIQRCTPYATGASDATVAYCCYS